MFHNNFPQQYRGTLISGEIIFTEQEKTKDFDPEVREHKSSFTNVWYSTVILFIISV